MVEERPGSNNPDWDEQLNIPTLLPAPAQRQTGNEKRDPKWKTKGCVEPQERDLPMMLAADASIPHPVARRAAEGKQPSQGELEATEESLGS